MYIFDMISQKYEYKFFKTLEWSNPTLIMIDLNDGLCENLHLFVVFSGGVDF